MLWIAALLVVPFSGCIFGSQEELAPGDGVGNQRVDLRLQAVGQSPGNLSGVSVTFAGLDFYEQETREWIEIPFSGNVSIAFDEPAAVPMTTVALPMGTYSKMRGSLGSVEVWEGEKAHPAVPLAKRCQVPVSLVLNGGGSRPLLTLYLFPEDALVEQDGTWYAQPAFSGSLTKRSGPVEDPAEGELRFTRPQCDGKG